MSAPSTLPLDLPAPSRRTRVKRAPLKQSPDGRVTSLKLQPVDELVLDALRERYGTVVIGQAIRRALHDAARAHGIDVDAFEREAAAAA